jgi:hypothetical protein
MDAFSLPVISGALYCTIVIDSEADDRYSTKRFIFDAWRTSIDIMNEEELAEIMSSPIRFNTFIGPLERPENRRQPMELGKRARSRATVEGDDRDDVLDGLCKKVTDDLRKIGAVNAVPPLQQAVDFINTMVRDVTANKDKFKKLLTDLPRDCLDKVQTILETKNGDAKIINMMKIIARNELKVLKELEDKKLELETALFSCTVFAVTAAFADDDGRLVWKALQDFVKKEVSTRDIALGIEQARDMRD